MRFGFLYTTFFGSEGHQEAQGFLGRGPLGPALVVWSRGLEIWNFSVKFLATWPIDLLKSCSSQITNLHLAYKTETASRQTAIVGATP